MNVVLIRNGELKLRLPNATIKSDGTVWYQGTPVVDKESPEARKIGQDKLKELVRARKIDQIPLKALARMGMNDSGLEILDSRVYDDRERAKIPPPSEAEKEYWKIVELQERAEKRIHDADDNNVSDHFSMLSRVKSLLEAWRKKYPEHARKNDAAELREKASKQRELAMGAMLYDSDGWIDREEQQKRHDEFMSKAMELEQEAAKLEK